MASTLASSGITVSIKHRDPYIAAGVQALLDLGEDCLVHAAGAELAHADVTVLDYPAAIGLAAQQGASRRRTQLLVISGEATGWHVRRALDAGVRGYLLEDCPADELLQAVHCVAEGGRFLPIRVAQHLAESLACEAPTKRELAVLELVANGLPNKDVGRRLGIAEGTVKTHLRTVFRKLGAPSRTAAMVEARSRGLLQI